MGLGLLVGIRTTESQPPEAIELAAAATADLFMGRNVTEMERLFRVSRGVEASAHHFNQTVIAVSDSAIHIFQRGKKYPNMVLCTVVDLAANLGMVLVRSRIALPSVEEVFGR